MPRSMYSMLQRVTSFLVATPSEELVWLLFGRTEAVRRVDADGDARGGAWSCGIVAGMCSSGLSWYKGGNCIRWKDVIAESNLYMLSFPNHATPRKCVWRRQMPSSNCKMCSKRPPLDLFFIALHQIAHLEILPPVKAHAAICTFPHLDGVLLAVLKRGKRAYSHVSAASLGLLVSTYHRTRPLPLASPWLLHSWQQAHSSPDSQQ